MKTMISSFTGDYRFLSNFYPCLVSYEGINYPSVEHAYQAAKSLDREVRRRIAKLPAANQAKMAGAVVHIRLDWDQVKLQIMEDLLRIKFSSPKMAHQLLDTRDHDLVEGNTWGDRFWGICNGKGENHLGRLLMKVRQDLIRTLI